MRTLAPRLALALLAAASSCGPLSPPVAPPSPPPPAAGLRPVACAGARPQETVTATANAQGAATLVMAGPRGQHMLRIPPRAARPGTVFTMTPLPAPSVGVDIRADGRDSYTFLEGRATLALSGEHCSDGEWGRVKGHVVARLGENTPRAVSAPGAARGKRVQAELGSLSGYAVSGN